MPTKPITASQLKQDIETLESAQRRFRNRAQAAGRQGQRSEQADADALAALFGRAALAYRTAQRSGALGVTYRTADRLDGNGCMISATRDTKPAAITDTSDGVSIALPRREWLALTTALRRDSRLQPQLGRLPWMCISHIEGSLAKESR